MRQGTRQKSGIALLAVLIVIVMIVIVSLSFISRSDGELAYGQNMKLRAQADGLAESGLEHAKTLILNPQDLNLAAGAYWTGASGQQLGSGDVYYDVSVQRHTTGTTPLCSFDVVSTGYRLSGASRVAESTLAAELRLDPCIALWTGGSCTTGGTTAVNGDVYCGGNIVNWRTINGDVYAAGSITGTTQGRKHTPTTTPPVQWPPVTIARLVPNYYVNGASYAASAIGVSPATGYAIAPSAGNPAGVAYYVGDLELRDNTNIQGTLVVSGNLTIKGINNRITATKNYPAIVVGGNIHLHDNSSLSVNGLVVAGGSVSMQSFGIHLAVNGGLYAAQNANIDAWQMGSSTTITADHSRTALLLWNSDGTYVSWRQAGLAFFENLRRQP